MALLAPPRQHYGYEGGVLSVRFLACIVFPGRHLCLKTYYDFTFRCPACSKPIDLFPYGLPALSHSRELAFEPKDVTLLFDLKKKFLCARVFNPQALSNLYGGEFLGSNSIVYAPRINLRNHRQPRSGQMFAAGQVSSFSSR